MREKLIYILIISILFASCDFTSADEYYNRAIELDKQGKHNEAIILLDKAIDKKHNFRPALLNRGVYKSELENFKEGIIDYNKILEFDSDNTYALFNIGNNYSSLNDSKNAITYYSKALKTKGALKTTNGGMVIRTNFDFKRFDSDMDYEMFDCEIYFERGLEFLKIKEFDKAISDINKSLKAKNAVMDCYFLLGEAYVGKKDSINACDNFIKSAKLGDKEAREMLKKHCIKKE